MTYSVIETIGEAEVHHMYEGTPEEIAKLIGLIKSEDKANFDKGKEPDILITKELKKQDVEALQKHVANQIRSLVK
ncbi:hypothetical protein [Solibacillus isronensis]|uniref:hypothetical protein n=1 Tax=Solibacillus isronensis TaxID=412383 RepID=UPI0039A3461A